MYYAVIGVAIASLTDRRIVAGAAVIGLFLVTSIASGIIVGDDCEFGRRLGRRADQRARRCRCTCATSCSSATSIPTSPLDGVDNGGLLAVVVYVVVLLVGVGVLLRRYRWVER